jgi:serine/threonine-protein kinase
MADEEPRVRAEARIGSVLNGKYRIDRVLGEGGMGTVFAATHTRNKNRVAVKVLHPELASNAVLRERFLREGYAANTVEHPGTVRILDDETAEDGTVFLVMDLLEGETLEARWQRKGRRLGAQHVAQLLYQLLDVLAQAHTKGIVHRDIKPENLFLTRDGTLKILDFGVARLLERSVSVTHSGGVLGTPAFMAPEQVLGKTKEVDAQSDLWSVGATAFSLLSGRCVHDAETAEEMMVFTASQPARPLLSVLPQVPPSLARVIDRALLTRKSDRWPDARAMQAAVAMAYKDAFGTALPEETEKKTTLNSVPAPASARGPTGSAPGSPVADAAIEPGAPPDSVSTTLPRPVATMSGASTWTRRLMGIGPDGSSADRRRLRTPVLVALAVSSTLLGGGIIAVAMGGRRAPSAASTLSVPPAPSEITSIRPLVGPVPSATGSDGPIATAEPPTLSVEALPTMTRPPNVGPKATVKDVSSGGQLSPSAPAPKRNCSPLFTVDSKGIKKWKAECL